MENEVKKFDPNEAMQKVKDRIKDSFVSLIPEEQWNGMVKKEIDSYFAEQSEGYGDRGRSSSFTKDVHEVLKEETRLRTKAYLSENFTPIWNNDGVSICNEFIENIIVKNSGKILVDLIGAPIQSVIQGMGYRM